MRLKDLIRAPKSITNEGVWKTGQKMPKNVFPLSKNRSLVIRGKYTWRVVAFASLGRTFRILIAYRTDIEEYRAYLGELSAGDITVICMYEFHGTHPGWHAHTTCDEIEILDSGRTKQPSMKRLKKSDDLFNLDETKALYIAHKAFGLLNTGGGLL